MENNKNDFIIRELLEQRKIAVDVCIRDDVKNYIHDRSQKQIYTIDNFIRELTNNKNVKERN